MSFQPVLPMAGLAGWRFLQRTMDTQTATFNSGAQITRDTDYFLEKIGKIDTAEQLVSDRRLLRVALGAHGLQSDIDNRFFIRKVLEDGTLKSDALSNRLADDRYKSFSKAFGFGDFPVPNTKLSDFGAKTVALYRKQQFEQAVGEQDNAMRLALNADRQLPEIAGGSSSENARWFRIMGTAPLREVFEVALGLPKSFGQIDIDQQLQVFQEKARGQLGLESVGDLARPEVREQLVQRYLLRTQVAEAVVTGPASVALSLLQNIPRRN
ncbi:DUF1217 domain-containing protein [Lutimaribacter sp. EGI FJ00015]|uniref:DUF1217 domain-containing protein n=1 Tax=Lutimaribacter degradans TaxID=2945989 RepID=A0ACC5ZU85_9RHOB|nr:DUF1217 domain-containing protein [Lutimaribacter sp. EGI FJ00013]MCM2561892.1 DUF1217 domain-containing protein [Lutimaribacter sp. EGI FJ00013]MCO0613076.1 DUF1217 domain-containing protein [Lutimaribacter sp. EGI FJ00015]MCO0635724.1 DUF1217 domain-containing protein [Lutimaribacter sp. EGI FJ00014]